MCHTPESTKTGAVSPPHHGSGPRIIYESAQTVFRGSQQLTAELGNKKKAEFEKQKSPNCLIVQWKPTAASELQRKLLLKLK